MRQFVLAFDVGGTSIKGAAVTVGGIVEERTYLQLEARSQEPKEAILDHLYRTVKELAERTEAAFPPEPVSLQGVGFAFPGPFDYERGVSYIRGLSKFESLYGVNVKEEVTRRIEGDERLADRLQRPLRIAFGNDASLFALGEAAYGEASRFRRSVCLTIGTGLGSSFVEEGRLVAERSDVPLDGWLFRLPWKDGVVDDYASRRGILRLAKSMGFDTEKLDVKELAEAASAGEAKAIELFRGFGRELGTILATYASPFRPEAVVLGGRIADGSGLFVPAMSKELAKRGCPVAVAQSADTLRSTFRGISDHVLQTN